MRDEQPHWTTVFGLQILAIKSKGDPCLSVLEIIERKIGRVVAEGVSHDVGSLRLHIRKQGVERDTLPRGSKLRPSRHTMQVHGGGFGRQRAKCFPVPSPQQG